MHGTVVRSRFVSVRSADARRCDRDRSRCELGSCRCVLSSSMDLPREIRTERLLLRRWVQSDRVPFAEINADPRVMEHFPSVLTRAESDVLVDRIEAHFERHGFGLWAVEVLDQIPFVGFVGLAIPSFDAHFTPCVEVGWRLCVESWGRGYATEARSSGGSLRLRTARAQRNRLVYGAREPALSPCHGTTQHDARSGG